MIENKDANCAASQVLHRTRAAWLGDLKPARDDGRGLASFQAVRPAKSSDIVTLVSFAPCLDKIEMPSREI